MQHDREEDSGLRSPIAAALEARPRTRHPFDALRLQGPGGEPLKIHFQVLNKLEEDEAVRAATLYCRTSGENAAPDSDLLTDAKAIEAMFRACVDEKGHRVFPGPQWMRKWLTSDDVAVLLNHYLEVRRKESPLTWHVDDIILDALIEACEKARGTTIPEIVMSRIPREALSSVAVELAWKLSELRRKSDPSDEAAA